MMGRYSCLLPPGSSTICFRQALVWVYISVFSKPVVGFNILVLSVTNQSKSETQQKLFLSLRHFTSQGHFTFQEPVQFKTSEDLNKNEEKWHKNNNKNRSINHFLDEKVCENKRLQICIFYFVRSTSDWKILESD